MWTERGRLGIVTKRELKNCHAGEAEFIPDGLYFRGDYAEVLGDQGQFAQRCLRSLKQGYSRTFHPAAIYGGCFARRNFPIGFETSKMIEADHVQHSQRGAKAFQPPTISVASQRVPTIDWIAPQLASSAEIIRRNAGHNRG